MSHVTEITLTVTDLDALEAAAKRLGGQLHRNKRTYKWYGRFMGDSTPPAWMRPEDFGKCEHCISIPGCDYEIGLVRKPGAPGWQLVWDSWRHGGLTRALGENAERLKTAYAAEAATRAARRKGWTVAESKPRADGTIMLTLQKWR
jgi:hypothetical protein